MIFDINFPTAYAKATVWSDEAPQLELSRNEPVFTSEAAAARLLSNSRKIALEVTITAGKTNYALVGGTFTPDDSGRFVAKVRPNPPGEKPLSWSLRGKYEDVYRGLLPAYLVAIQDFVSVPSTWASLGSGLLELDYFAYGDDSSSYAWFYLTASALVSAIASNAGTQSEIEAVVIRKFSWGRETKPYWIEFAENSVPVGSGLEYGFGATTRFEFEVLSRLADHLYGRSRRPDQTLPKMKSIVKDVDVSSLDPINVRPYVGDTPEPGIWFPPILKPFDKVTQ